MLTRSDVITRIEPIIRDLFDEYQGPVTATLSAKEVEQWDSLANVQLLVMVEKAFGLRFSTSEIATLKNVGELADLITARTAQKASRLSR